jgi:hypothetical protein
MPAAPSDNPFTIARPFLWLAALAFLIGFLGYLALGHPNISVAHSRAQPVAVSGPSSAEWNMPKHI